MIVTILGCGGSGGVPMIGDQWGNCNPANPKNRRTRASILIQQGDTTILVDSSPDLRYQFLREGIKHVTAVVYTHAHADHTHGIDDLRSLNWLMKQPIPIYGDAFTMEKLKTRFDYIFTHKEQTHSYYRPALEPHLIEGPLQFGDVTLIPFEQDHGYIKSLGIRAGNFAYTTDAKSLNENAFNILKGIDTWVVDCVSHEEHPTHSHMAQTLEWIEKVKPERAFLTHMGYRMDYDDLCAQLPPHIRPAYDGLKITLA